MQALPTTLSEFRRLPRWRSELGTFVTYGLKCELMGCGYFRTGKQVVGNCPEHQATGRKLMSIGKIYRRDSDNRVFRD